MRSVRARLALLLAIAATLSTAAGAFGAGSGLRATRADRLLVRLAPGATLPAPLAPGARHLFDRWWRVGTGGAPDLVTLRAALARAPGIERIDDDVVFRIEPPLAPSSSRPAAPAGAGGDPLLVQQWALPAVQAEEAWQRATGAGVVVAVVDSGVTQGGTDGFCQPLAGEYDAVQDDSGPGAAADLIGHGTFVASVVAECGRNGIGAAGLAWGARILAIRACTSDGECTSSDVAAAIDWAVDHGAKVVNLSLGMPCPDADWPECSTEIENDAIARAIAAGVSIVAIAGNRGDSRIGFPANHPDVVGVGGLDTRLLKASYASWGSALSLSAPAGEPGVDLDGDGYEDQILAETLKRVCGFGSGFAYCRWSGTSFAGPHVSAALALLLEAHPEASPAQLKRAVEESALDRGAPGFDPIYGHGALRAAAAIERLDAIVAEEGDCAPAANRLCLGGASGGGNGSRFAAEVTWRNYAGATGHGTAFPLTTDSGLFWFFAPANLEMLVKVVDGCSLNGHWWVYAAATTDVEYELTVTDTETGLSRPYRNTLGMASPAFTDSAAFACAP